MGGLEGAGADQEAIGLGPPFVEVQGRLGPVQVRKLGPGPGLLVGQGREIGGGGVRTAFRIPPLGLECGHALQPAAKSLHGREIALLLGEGRRHPVHGAADDVDIGLDRLHLVGQDRAQIPPLPAERRDRALEERGRCTVELVRVVGERAGEARLHGPHERREGRPRDLLELRMERHIPVGPGEPLDHGAEVGHGPPDLPRRLLASGPDPRGDRGRLLVEERRQVIESDRGCGLRPLLPAEEVSDKAEDGHDQSLLAICRRRPTPSISEITATTSSGTSGSHASPSSIRRRISVPLWRSRSYIASVWVVMPASAKSRTTSGFAEWTTWNGGVMDRTCAAQSELRRRSSIGMT